MPAEQRREVEAGLTQVDALRSELVAIEDHFHLRLIELDVRVGEDEQPARERLLHELSGELAELLRFACRRNHDIDREVSSAWQRRRDDRDDADARDLRQRPHRLHHELLGRLRSARSTASSSFLRIRSIGNVIWKMLSLSGSAR